jgi:hypothetical protein
MLKKRTKAQLAADKRRTGRPPKSPKERQGCRVTVHLTEEERAHIEKLAQQEGISLAAAIMTPWRKKEQ